MSEYLSKEEIRKWRSSLERITLEEYAARLGKVIQEEKHDDSLVDSVMLRSLSSMSTEKYAPKTEKIQSLSIKSFNREKELKEKKEVKPEIQIKEAVKKIVEPKKKAVSKEKEQVKKEDEVINVSFNKALTSREQLVFDHFMANKNTIVYAKDLAKILELPRDYVYKYIKNLRSKLNEDVLQNADNGGYVLKV
ncbi:MAG: helix-turn-helix domain-containing protein [Candidatus Gastranaerophilales bacterium]|nr:helix-turn-helix domain-containing protein [Candidatus Gastranaerophilales bacterium]